MDDLISFGTCARIDFIAYLLTYTTELMSFQLATTEQMQQEKRNISDFFYRFKILPPPADKGFDIESQSSQVLQLSIQCNNFWPGNLVWNRIAPGPRINNKTEVRVLMVQEAKIR